MTYFRIWIPLTISDTDTPRDTELRERGWRDQHGVLLASGDTILPSILAMRYRFDSNQEAASIISIIIMTMTVALASLMRGVWASPGSATQPEHPSRPMIGRRFLTTGNSCEYEVGGRPRPGDVEILNGVTRVLRLLGVFGYQ